MFARYAFAAALAMSAPALAQDRPEIVRGLCSKDGCDEFAVISKEQVTGGYDGSLYRTRVQAYHASRSGRADRGQEDGYVYCSKFRPAILAVRSNGPPVAVLLAPFAQTPAYVQRQTTNYDALYFALCHGNEAGRSAAQNRPAVAQSLGYRVDLASPKTVTLRRIEDILDPKAGG